MPIDTDELAGELTPREKSVRKDLIGFGYDVTGIQEELDGYVYVTLKVKYVQTANGSFIKAAE